MTKRTVWVMQYVPLDHRNMFINVFSSASNAKRWFNKEYGIKESKEWVQDIRGIWCRGDYEIEKMVIVDNAFLKGM